MFTPVRIGIFNQHECPDLGRGYSDTEREESKGTVLLSGVSGEGAFYSLSEWIHYAGASPSYLKIGCSPVSNFHENFEVMLGSLKEKYLALRDLDLTRPNSDFLCSYPSNTALLSALHWWLQHLTTWGAHGSKIKQHCTGLRSLVLHDAPRNLRGLLFTVGPCLESFKASMLWILEGSELNEFGHIVGAFRTFPAMSILMIGLLWLRSSSRSFPTARN